MEKELLSILCCPETKQELTPADQTTLDALNQRIEEGTLKSRNGEILKEKIQGGLIRKDGQYLYPIQNDIPIMLIDSAIPLK